jgi:hypothetical protein
VRLLAGWVNDSRQMPFAIPKVWRKPKDHSSDFYFCLRDMTGITSKSKRITEYPDLPSAVRPISHGEELRIPKPPEIGLLVMKTLILTKITDNKKGTILMKIRHMKQVVPHLNSFY